MTTIVETHMRVHLSQRGSTTGAAPRPAATPKKERAKPSPPKRKMPLEVDEGYGESHGYAPGHGGPSGPGDAPATPQPAPKKAGVTATVDDGIAPRSAGDRGE